MVVGCSNKITNLLGAHCWQICTEKKKTQFTLICLTGTFSRSPLLSFVSMSRQNTFNSVERPNDHRRTVSIAPVHHMYSESRHVWILQDTKSVVETSLV
jgi:hypothetical protein